MGKLRELRRCLGANLHLLHLLKSLKTK